MSEFASTYAKVPILKRQILEALLRTPMMTTEDLSNRLGYAKNVVRGRLSRLHVWGCISHDDAIPRTWKLEPKGRRIAMTGCEIDEVEPRTVRIGNATLILGDCRDVLPTLPCVDAVVTDPPYGIDYSKQGGFSSKSGWRVERGEAGWDTERPDAELFQRIRKLSVHQIIWGANHFADRLPVSKCWLVWDKGQRSFSVGDCELAWTSFDRAARILTYARGKETLNREHPTQKPVELMHWCLGFLDAGDALRDDGVKVILDPFMGAGTTGIACAQKGLEFIGIERNERYFQMACRRIAEAQKQPTLFPMSDVRSVTGCAVSVKETA